MATSCYVRALRWVVVVLFLRGMLCAWNTSVTPVCLIPPAPLINITEVDMMQEIQRQSLSTADMFESFTPLEWKSLKLDARSVFSGSATKHAFVVRARAKRCTVRLLPEFCHVGRLRLVRKQDQLAQQTRIKVNNEAALYSKWAKLSLNAAEELVFSLLDLGVYRVLFIGNHDDVLNRQSFDFLLCDLLRMSTRLQPAPEFDSRGRMRAAVSHDNVVLFSFIVHWPGSRHHLEVFQIMFLSNREPFQHHILGAEEQCPTLKTFGRDEFSYMYNRLDAIDLWWPGRRSSNYAGSHTYNLSASVSPTGGHNTTKDKELIIFNTNGRGEAQVQAMRRCSGFSEQRHILMPRLKALIKFVKDYPNKYGLFRESVNFTAVDGFTGDGAVSRLLHGLEPSKWYRYLGYVNLQQYSHGFPVLTASVNDNVTQQAVGAGGDIVKGVVYSPFIMGVFWQRIRHELSVLLQRRRRPDPWMDAW